MCNLSRMYPAILLRVKSLTVQLPVTVYTGEADSLSAYAVRDQGPNVTPLPGGRPTEDPVLLLPECFPMIKNIFEVVKRTNDQAKTIASNEVIKR